MHCSEKYILEYKVVKAVTGSREQLVARSRFPPIAHQQEFGEPAFTGDVWLECFWHCSAVLPFGIQLHSQAPESFQVLWKQAQEQGFAELTFGAQNGRTQKRKNIEAAINTNIYQ